MVNEKAVDYDRRCSRGGVNDRVVDIVAQALSLCYRTLEFS